MPQLDLGQLAGIFHNSYVLIGNKIPHLRDGFKRTKKHTIWAITDFKYTDHRLSLHIALVNFQKVFCTWFPYFLFGGQV